ncbi:unnamed protein product [Musa acuminata var. zebrina]
MAGGNAGVARGPRGPRHWRETQSEGGQPGGGKRCDNPRPCKTMERRPLSIDPRGSNAPIMRR